MLTGDVREPMLLQKSLQHCCNILYVMFRQCGTKGILEYCVLEMYNL
jgi:hypothetical protein